MSLCRPITLAALSLGFLSSTAVAADELDCSTRAPEFTDFGLPHMAALWNGDPGIGIEPPAYSSSYGGCIPTADFDGPATRLLVLDNDASLCDGAATYRMSVFVGMDNTSLDCRGATIQPQRVLSSALDGLRTTRERSISGLTIRNCNFVGTAEPYSLSGGVSLVRYFRDDGEDPEVDPGSSEGDTRTLTGTLRGHSNIVIENVSTVNASWGVFVGQRSSHVTLWDVTLSDSRSGGIYLEAGSTGTRVARSVIDGTKSREGIAIDSSTDNVIESNIFVDNATDPANTAHAGSVNLYKNAGELYGQICPISRQEGADRNVIRWNYFFTRGLNHGSRAGYPNYACSNGSVIDCQDDYPDYARDNAIYENLFQEDTNLVIRGLDLPLLKDNEFQGGGVVVEMSPSPPIAMSSDVSFWGRRPVPAAMGPILF